MREGRVKQSLDTRMEETAGAEQGSTLQEAWGRPRLLGGHVSVQSFQKELNCVER